MNHKERADTINSYRIFPRIFAILYAVLVALSANWYMELEDPSAQQTAFVSAIATSSAAYFKFYVQSGKRDDPSA